MLKVAGGGGTAGLTYKGTWDASTNSPSLSSGVGTNGDYYVVNVAGSTNLDGITDWQIGDWAIFNGTVWQKIDQSNTVTSVNGETGAVVLGVANIAGAVPNTVNVIADGLLSGGGALTANVTVSLTNVPVANVTGAVPNTVNILTAGLATGGGALTGNVTITVNDIPAANVTGLGTMALQNAFNVSITGGNVNVANTVFIGATSNTASMPDPSLPLNPEGYITVNVAGSLKKIPYYGV